MRIFFLAFALALGASRAFADKEYPAGYWEKNYNTGNSPVATYSVTIQVKDLARATSEADRRITKAGGSLTSMNSNGAYDSSGRQMRNLNYSLDAKTAEATAKSFFDLGELQGYNASRNAGNKDADEIRDKLKELTAERDGNADCLAKMPISSSYLNGRITQLQQALAAIEGGGAKANLSLSLIEPPKKK